MSEYIGSRISLISKRDIRYVGTLHEINSETSTVALEQVKSYGTEGRSEEEVPPSDNVYEYIVFRGSDVKDLRIEKEPEKKSQPPQVPDDPAILGNARPPGVPSASSHPVLPSPQPPLYGQQGRGQPPRYPQHSPYGYGGYPPPLNQRFGPYGPPQGYPPQGYHGIPYGPPPGWYGPSGQGHSQGPPGQMIPPHGQQGFPTQPPPPQTQPSKSATPAPDGIDTMGVAQPPVPIEKLAASVKLPIPVAPAVKTQQNGPPPPTESKPDVSAALAPPTQVGPADTVKSRPRPTTQRSGHIQPAIPMKSPVINQKQPVNGTSLNAAASTSKTVATTAEGGPAIEAPVPTKTLEDANRDARAAVAAAMAKLPPSVGQQKKAVNGDNGMDNLTRKVNEMRVNDNSRPKSSATPGHGTGRGPRGGHRGARPRNDSQVQKIEVPKTDYDFESANAKFNKQDLVKEAIAGGEPANSPANGTSTESLNKSRRDSESMSQPSTTVYNKSSSFFDNISSESRDRDDHGTRKIGGREFRNEEQKKNMETFGQGSVDSYRGGYRGRGRGRGSRGRGGYGRGRGGIRGRAGFVTTES